MEFDDLIASALKYLQAFSDSAKAFQPFNFTQVILFTFSNFFAFASSLLFYF